MLSQTFFELKANPVKGQSQQQQKEKKRRKRKGQKNKKNEKRIKHILDHFLYKSACPCKNVIKSDAR